MSLWLLHFHQIFTPGLLNGCMKPNLIPTFNSIRAIALVLGVSIALSPTSDAQPTATPEQAAVDLYNQHKYVQAADAFEQIMRIRPSARLCYYAALANWAGNRETRARQLFQYVANTYPKTPEAALAKNALATSSKSTSTAAASSSNDELPALIQNSLPPEMQALLNTDIGKQAVRQALKDHAKEVETIKVAEKDNRIDKEAVANLVRNTAATSSPARKTAPRPGSDHPFTAQDIARDGAEGIDQSRFPNCWFEASMSALAQLPRGQRLLASMIRSRSKDEYVVRFPGDGVEYVVSSSDLNSSGVHDRALWASIIEAAEIKKFPDNSGAEGKDGDQSRLEVGLGCITGCKAEVVRPGNCGEEELSSFIGAAVKSQNPVVAGTWGEHRLSGLPDLVFPAHAYTIIGFDQAKSMIILRNPHGHGAQSFSDPDDPQHLEFEQLDNGKFKMSVRHFQKYFNCLARSFI